MYTILHSHLLSSSLISQPFLLHRSIPLSMTLLRPQFQFPNSWHFYSDSLLVCWTNPNLEGQSTFFITPGAEWPSYTSTYPWPFWSPFTTYMGCRGTVLFFSHHMGKSCGARFRYFVGASLLLYIRNCMLCLIIRKTERIKCTTNCLLS